MTATPTKAELRRQLRARRGALTRRQQARAAAELAHRLTATRAFRASRRIACYLPNDGEIDPRPLIERIWTLGKDCYLPVLSHTPHEHLWFARVMPDTPLTLNTYGIPEPRIAGEWLRARQLDLILLPLVGFDLAGNRLGMGAGFYDRCLEYLRLRRVWKKPRVVGLAHDCQRVAQLPVNDWDIALDAVVTDRAVYSMAGEANK
ncbi:MAG: 5-formyltetrahydrofolate cyclo-ligase [Gammaproteobacteria bacterium]|nr:5-formyltetrahydrofolate cyclo-ligase [Gammaproteobacteria bacterium]